MLYDEIRDPGIRQFLDVWLSLFHDAGHVAPQRWSIDPHRLRGLLPCVWLYERTEDKSYTCLLAGEEISFAWARPMRLRKLSEIIPHGGHLLVESRFNVVLDEQVIAHGLSPTTGKAHIVAERLYAPIADRDGEVRYVFGISRYQQLKQDSAELYSDGVRDAVVRCYRPQTLEVCGEFMLGNFVVNG